jgi:hypothetical protein
MPDTTTDCPAPAVVRDLLAGDFERVARDGYIASVAGRDVRLYREQAISRTPGGTVCVTGELLWRQPIPDARETIDQAFGHGDGVAP